MAARSFTDLEVWRLADELDTEIDRLAQLLPSEERFRLADQMIRAARAIPASIAEGFGCYWPKRKAQFCQVGKASCGELVNHVFVAAKHTWCKDPKPLLEKIDRLQRLLSTFDMPEPLGRRKP